MDGGGTFVQEQRQRSVAVTETAASADLVATLLAAHGIHAATAAYDLQIPSINWVQGYRVGVPSHELERALEILRVMSGRDDLALLEDDPFGA